MDQGVDKDSICQACGKNELVFAEPNTTEHFCQWLFYGENEVVTVTTDWFSFLLNKCGKYPFLSSSNPNVLGNSDNALGKKLMESIILIRHPGTSIYIQGVDKDSICQTCGKNELVFPGPNTTEHFCQWLFSGENEGVNFKHTMYYT
jgi:hypothetical protein